MVENHESLRTILDTFNNGTRQLNSMVSLSMERDQIWIHLTKQRLPKTTLDSWEQYRSRDNGQQFLDIKSKGRREYEQGDINTNRSSTTQKALISGDLIQTVMVEYNQLCKMVLERLTERLGTPGPGILARKCDTIVIWVNNDHGGTAIAKGLHGLCKEVNTTANILIAKYEYSAPDTVKHALKNAKAVDETEAARLSAYVHHTFRLKLAYILLLNRSFGKIGTLYCSLTTVTYNPSFMVAANFVYNTNKAPKITTYTLNGNYGPDNFKGTVGEKEAEIWEEKKVKATVVAYVEKSETIQIPPATNTLKAFADCWKLFHLTAEEAMRIFQYMYVNKKLSYPRSDTTEYPKNFVPKLK